MKIIANASSSSYSPKFLVEMTEDEISQVAGYHNKAYLPKNQQIEIGKEMDVSRLWGALNDCRKRREEMDMFVKNLRSAATRIEKINEALADPIVEVKIEK